MDKQNTDPPQKRRYSERIITQYISAYFDHLRSEYARVAPTADPAKIQQLQERLRPVIERRER